MAAPGSAGNEIVILDSQSSSEDEAEGSTDVEMKAMKDKLIGDFF